MRSFPDQTARFESLNEKIAVRSSTCQPFEEESLISRAVKRNRQRALIASDSQAALSLQIGGTEGSQSTEPAGFIPHGKKLENVPAFRLDKYATILSTLGEDAIVSAADSVSTANRVLDAKAAVANHLHRYEMGQMKRRALEQEIVEESVASRKVVGAFIHDNSTRLGELETEEEFAEQSEYECQMRSKAMSSAFHVLEDLGTNLGNLVSRVKDVSTMQVTGRLSKKAVGTLTSISFPSGLSTCFNGESDVFSDAENNRNSLEAFQMQHLARVEATLESRTKALADALNIINALNFQHKQRRAKTKEELKKATEELEMMKLYVKGLESGEGFSTGWEWRRGYGVSGPFGEDDSVAEKVRSLFAPIFEDMRRERLRTGEELKDKSTFALGKNSVLNNATEKEDFFIPLDSSSYFSSSFLSPALTSRRRSLSHMSFRGGEFSNRDGSDCGSSSSSPSGPNSLPHSKHHHDASTKTIKKELDNALGESRFLRNEVERMKQLFVQSERKAALKEDENSRLKTTLEEQQRRLNSLLFETNEKLLVSEGHRKLLLSQQSEFESLKRANEKLIASSMSAMPIRPNSRPASASSEKRAPSSSSEVLEETLLATRTEFQAVLARKVQFEAHLRQQANTVASCLFGVLKGLRSIQSISEKELPIQRPSKQSPVSKTKKAHQSQDSQNNYFDLYRFHHTTANRIFEASVDCAGDVVKLLRSFVGDESDRDKALRDDSLPPATIESLLAAIEQGHAIVSRPKPLHLKENPLKPVSSPEQSQPKSVQAPGTRILSSLSISNEQHPEQKQINIAKEKYENGQVSEPQTAYDSCGLSIKGWLTDLSYMESLVLRIIRMTGRRQHVTGSKCEALCCETCSPTIVEFPIKKCKSEQQGLSGEICKERSVMPFFSVSPSGNALFALACCTEKLTTLVSQSASLISPFVLGEIEGLRSEAVRLRLRNIKRRISDRIRLQRHAIRVLGMLKHCRGRIGDTNVTASHSQSGPLNESRIDQTTRKSVRINEGGNVVEGQRNKGKETSQRSETSVDGAKVVSAKATSSILRNTTLGRVSKQRSVITSPTQGKSLPLPTVVTSENYLNLEDNRDNFQEMSVAIESVRASVRALLRSYQKVYPPLLSKNGAPVTNFHTIVEDERTSTGSTELDSILKSDKSSWALANFMQDLATTRSEYEQEQHLRFDPSREIVHPLKTSAMNEEEFALFRLYQTRLTLLFPFIDELINRGQIGEIISQKTTPKDPAVKSQIRMSTNELACARDQFENSGTISLMGIPLQNHIEVVASATEIVVPSDLSKTLLTNIKSLIREMLTMETRLPNTETPEPENVTKDEDPTEKSGCLTEGLKPMLTQYARDIIDEIKTHSDSRLSSRTETNSVSTQTESNIFNPNDIHKTDILVETSEGEVDQRLKKITGTDEELNTVTLNEINVLQKTVPISKISTKEEELLTLEENQTHAAVDAMLDDWFTEAQKPVKLLGDDEDGFDRHLTGAVPQSSSEKLIRDEAGVDEKGVGPDRLQERIQRLEGQLCVAKAKMSEYLKELFSQKAFSGSSLGVKKHTTTRTVRILVSEPSRFTLTRELSLPLNINPGTLSVGVDSSARTSSSLRSLEKNGDDEEGSFANSHVVEKDIPTHGRSFVADYPTIDSSNAFSPLAGRGCVGGRLVFTGKSAGANTSVDQRGNSRGDRAVQITVGHQRPLSASQGRLQNPFASKSVSRLLVPRPQSASTLRPPIDTNIDSMSKARPQKASGLNVTGHHESSQLSLPSPNAFYNSRPVSGAAVSLRQHVSNLTRRMHTPIKDKGTSCNLQDEEVHTQRRLSQIDDVY